MSSDWRHSRAYQLRYGRELTASCLPVFDRYVSPHLALAARGPPVRWPSPQPNQQPPLGGGGGLSPAELRARREAQDLRSQARPFVSRPLAYLPHSLQPFALRSDSLGLSLLSHQVITHHLQRLGNDPALSRPCPCPPTGAVQPSRTGLSAPTPATAAEGGAVETATASTAGADADFEPGGGQGEEGSNGSEDDVYVTHLARLPLFPPPGTDSLLYSSLTPKRSNSLRLCMGCSSIGSNQPPPPPPPRPYHPLNHFLPHLPPSNQPQTQPFRPPQQQGYPPQRMASPAPSMMQPPPPQRVRPSLAELI